MKLILPQRLEFEFGIRLGDRQRRRLEEQGLFPKRVAITGRSHAYINEELAAYVERKIAARNSVSA